MNEAIFDRKIYWELDKKTDWQLMSYFLNSRLIMQKRMNMERARRDKKRK